MGSRYDKAEKHQAFLYDIERAVIYYYREHPELTDYSVGKVYELVERLYTAESQGKKPPKARLNEAETTIYEAVKTVCQQWMDKPNSEYNPALIADLFKGLRSSIRLWGTDYGRQGYLNYVNGFIT